MAKVLILASFPDSLLNFRAVLLQMLVNHGHSVIAVSPESERVSTALAAFGVEFRKVEMNRNSVSFFSDMKYFAKLVRIFRETRPDVVLAYTLKPVVFGGLASQFTGDSRFSAMITGRGQVFSDSPRLGAVITRALTTFALRIGLLKAHRTFFQNNEDLEFFVGRRLVTGERAIRTAGSGVDLTHFTKAPMPTATSFLMLARLIREKGILEYIAAARRIKAAHTDVTFRLAGMLEPGYNHVDPEVLSAWENEGVIEYLGNLTDVREAIASSSVVVLPSYYPEGVPRSLQEALAMGRPVITTDTPGCRETVAGGRTGFLVPPRDSEALTAAMLRFVDDPGLAGKMTLDCRAYASDRYDAATISSQILRELDLFR